MDNLKTDMLDMGVEEIANLPPDVLNDLHWKIGEELVRARRRENTLHLAFEVRYAGKAGEALLADGRDTGTVHLTDGRFDVTVTRPKKITWDQKALVAALDTFDTDTARHYAKTAFSVEERKFVAAPPQIQQALAAARTVSVGKATYALSERVAA